MHPTGAYGRENTSLIFAYHRKHREGWNLSMTRIPAIFYLSPPKRRPKEYRCQQEIHQIHTVSDAVAPRKAACGMSHGIHHKAHRQYQQQKPQFPACFFRHGKSLPVKRYYFIHGKTIKLLACQNFQLPLSAFEAAHNFLLIVFFDCR